MDVLQFTCSALIITSHLGFGPFHDLQFMRLLATYVVILLWIKIAEVARVLRIFSFYVKLIIETVKDMKAFLLVLAAIIIVFTTATYVNDMSSYQRGIGELTKFSVGEPRIMSTFYYEFLLTLGEFDVDHLVENEDLPSPIILFTMSTFIVQIVCLNMLIAIMGDTYDKV